MSKEHPDAQARRRFKRTRSALLTGAAVGLASVAVAACGSSGGGSGTGGGGGSSNAPGVNGKKVTVGLNLATSGPYAILGQTAAGTNAYFKQLNADGGVNGYKFTTVTGDNADSSSQVASVARQQANTTFTALGVADNILDGMGEIAQQTGQPIMVGANGSLLQPVQKYAYGLLPDYSSEGNFDAKFIMDNLKTKKFAFVYSDDDYGQPVAKTVEKYVKSQGGTIAASVPVSPTQTDFSSTAAKLKASGADVVLSWADLVAMPQIQKAAAAIGYSPKWVSGYGIVTPGYTSVAGSLAKGVYADYFQYPLNLKNSEVSSYKAAMAKDSPKDVESTFSQQGWTFGAIVAAAVKKATAGGKPLTRQGYLDALDSLPKGPVGLMSSVGFSPTRHYAANSTAMFQWTGSEWKQVTPYTTLSGS